MRILIFLLALAALLHAQNRNLLTAKEVSDGWILLYDGESAFGWSPEGGAQWSTDPDGVLTARAGDSGDMVLTTVFGDFQLACEVRAPSAKGSGLVLSGVSVPAPKAGDKWHSYTVTSSGGRVTASLDGKKFFEEQMSQKGAVVLHYRKGDSISFRQLKLRPMGLAPIFNGRDLGGWNVVPPAQTKVPAEWTARDGMIHVEHGPGQLEFERPFKDFILQLEVRANTADPKVHPNSGVFLRGEKLGFWTGYESQIRNEFRDNDRSQPVDFGTGAIYRYQPARKVVSSDNEFFTKTIVARGRHFAIWVNGIQVTDWDDDHPEGMVVANKEAKLTAGHISLQAHDPTTNLDFRNVRVGELN
jgi:hypothetical protein